MICPASCFFPTQLAADSCIHSSAAIPPCVFGWQQHPKDMIQPKMPWFKPISHCPDVTGPDAKLKASAES